MRRRSRKLADVPLGEDSRSGLDVRQTDISCKHSPSSIVIQDAMRIFFIRHGETVDNVAGLYAGVRDSALTNHGVEQARRLGAHFKKTSVILTHIFASPLSRARKTAEAVMKAQPTLESGELDIVQVTNLIEQDFGFYEGKPFNARTNPKVSGRDTHRKEHKDDPDFVDVESKESMVKRVDDFLDTHLRPLFEASGESTEATVAIVSHGILLSNLWRRLLLSLPHKSIRIAPEVITAKGSIVLEYLGGWSNTGYLELLLQKDNKEEHPDIDIEVLPSKEESEAATLPTVAPSNTGPVEVSVAPPSEEVQRPNSIVDTTLKKLEGWSTTIVAVDSNEHLVGLKRQRGGIGSLAHDEGQKKLDGFFKKQRNK